MALPIIVTAAGLLMLIGLSQQGECNCKTCEANASSASPMSSMASQSSHMNSPKNVARFAADAGPAHMNAEKAAAILGGQGDQVVMFYKPGCPPCEQTKPDFIAASSSGKAKTPMLLANVTEPYMAGLNQKMQITGVPHICRIRGGEQVDVLRDRSQEAIVAFANK
jgi:thiol-disulfide isomerase/thioredoxin